jgi:hypothetical protein
MSRYDLCLVWNWEHDADFVHLLEAACAARGVSLLQVTPETLAQVLARLESGGITFATFFDRASESDPRFQSLVDWASVHAIFHINPHERALWMNDKATMQPEFIRCDLDTPYTVILPSYTEQSDIPQMDLSRLGWSFAIKPACEGGGDGVILEASSWEQVLTARRQFPHEKYLLQAHVTPRILEGRPAWFRVLVCDGAVYPCWWDPHTHVHTRLTAEQKGRFGLRSLSEIPRRIAGICRLHLFSTEIALTADGRSLVVDYVNDPIDLRLQSKAADGVPDAIVENIAGRLARMADRYKSQT